MKALVIGFAVFCLYAGVVGLGIKFIMWVNANEYGGYALLVMGTLIASWLFGKFILKVMDGERM